MTLQQLIGELQTLAQAYPAETPVFVQTSGSLNLAMGVLVDSDDLGVQIIVSNEVS